MHKVCCSSKKMTPKPKSDSMSEFGPQNNNSDESKKLELQYNGYAYDVTSFVDKHPGGRIIAMYLKTKEDSFNAIQQFHFRAIDRVNKIMEHLPRRPINSKNGIRCTLHSKVH